jgi:hypothetical protein
MITFLLSTPVLLTIIAILLVILTITVEIEESGWATTLASISIALVVWKYWDPIWSWAVSSPWQVLGFIGVYIGFGLIWSIIKWAAYVKSYTRLFNSTKLDFEAKYGSVGENWITWTEKIRSNEQLKSFNPYLYYVSRSTTVEELAKTLILTTDNKKSVIVSWISYWPLSILGTIMNDPFRRLFTWIYNSFSGLYGKIGKDSTSNLMDGVTISEKELIKSKIK